MDEDLINAVADWRGTDQLSELEKLACEFAEAMTKTPAEVTDDLRIRLRTHLSEKQVTELANFIAWENARARFNRAFDIQPEGYASAAAPTGDRARPAPVTGQLIARLRG